MALLLPVEELERRAHVDLVTSMLGDIQEQDHEGMHVYVPSPVAIVLPNRDAKSLHEWSPKRYVSTRRKAGRCDGHNRGKNIRYNDDF